MPNFGVILLPRYDLGLLLFQKHPELNFFKNNNATKSFYITILNQYWPPNSIINIQFQRRSWSLSMCVLFSNFYKNKQDFQVRFTNVQLASTFLDRVFKRCG